jgi:amino acid transporter
MKKLILYILTIISSTTLSQTGVSKVIESNVTKNQHTVVVDDYNKNYTKLLKKAERQSDISNLFLITSTIVTSTILLNVDNLNYDRTKTVILTNTVFVGLSTTFFLSSNKNRRKAYELKRKNYL